MVTQLNSEQALKAFDLILPFIPELGPFLTDEAIQDICINGNGTVYVDRCGQMRCAGRNVLDSKKLMFALQRIARQGGEELDESNPFLDSRLPDGSRIAAAIAPYSVGGPTVTIRKFQRQHFSLDHLVELGTLTHELADLLRGASKARTNILISGQPGSGKTSIQNALLNELDVTRARLLVIEESAELQIHAENVTRFECRNVGKQVTIRDLVKVALRHRPDHLVIGEVRGAEAMDLLDALNTGNSGSLTTIHANSAQSALTKLSNLALRAGADVPYAAVQAQIADVIQYVIHMERKGNKRSVAELLRLCSYDFRNNAFQFELVFEGNQRHD
ncbi:MAG: CpaF family protein [Acidobacteriaceae bacterium]|nr:CpaF family protein [Acidobacteriaceae bacterium]